MVTFKSVSMLAGAAAIGAMALTGAPAPAAAVIFDFTTGANGNANQSATAEFNFSTANSFTITLTNTGTLVDIASILTDFQYNLSSAPTNLTLGTITGSGQWTCVYPCTLSATPTNETGNWNSTLTGATDLLQAGPGGALHPFGIANNSLLACTSATNCDGLNNAQHNPMINGPAVFNITTTGETSIPTISNVQFSFGTGPAIINGVPVPAPVIGHGLLALLAVGGVLFGGKLLESLKKHHLHAA